MSPFSFKHILFGKESNAICLTFFNIKAIERLLILFEFGLKYFLFFSAKWKSSFYNVFTEVPELNEIDIRRDS